MKKSMRKQVAPKKRVAQSKFLYYNPNPRPNPRFPGTDWPDDHRRFYALTLYRTARREPRRHVQQLKEKLRLPLVMDDETVNAVLDSDNSPVPHASVLDIQVDLLTAKASRLRSPEIDDFTTPRAKRRRVRPSPKLLPPTPVAVSNSFEVLSPAATPAAENDVDVEDPRPAVSSAKQGRKRRKRKVPSKTLPLAAPTVLSARPQPPRTWPTTRQLDDLVVQCYRCQGFGHYAISCPNASRCVKCARAHDAQQCRRPRRAKPTCANCNGPHTASYRGCPSWRFATRAERNSRRRATPGPSRPASDPPAAAATPLLFAGPTTSPVMEMLAKLLATLAIADPARHQAMLIAAVAAAV